MQTKTLSGFQLSPQQKRLWLLQQEGSAFLSQCAIRLEGALNPGVLKAAVQQIVNRHQILRTSFRRLPGVKTPVMVVADSGSPLWQDIDLSDEREQSAKINQLVLEARQQPVDFEQNSLLRLSLLKLSPTLHVLLVCLPALCADTRTIANLVAEIGDAYSACLNGEALGAEVVQFIQFSEWQNQLLEEEEAKAANEYWHQQQIASLDGLRLPLESQPVTRSQFQPDCFKFAIAPEVTAKIETLAQQYDTSAAVVLLACWQILIWRLTGQPDIVIGTASDRRDYEELQEVMGLLATWLPIKSQLSPDLRFVEVIELAQQTLAQAEEWQDYFVPEPVGHDKAWAFPIGFEFEQLPEKRCAAGVSFTVEQQYCCIEQFKIKLTCTGHDDAFIAQIGYDVNYYSTEAVASLAGQFQTLLTHAIEKPDTAIAQLTLLTPSNRQQLLVEFNQTQIDFPLDRCIHQLFEAQAQKTPDNVAVIFEDQQLTYAELNQKANQLAHYLQQRGVKPDVVVGLCVERSLDAIVGLLGILKAGGAYLPLDPALPMEGLVFRLQDTQASVLLTQKRLIATVQTHATPVVCLDGDWNEIAQHSDANPTSDVTSENLVYVMFTSGSTGKPKGVAVEHQQLLNYYYAIQDSLNLPANANFATVSTLAADLGNTVVFTSLCTGGCLHIVSAERAANSAALAQYCQKHPIDCLKIVPSHLAALLVSSSAQSILPRQLLILGGEAASWHLIEQIQAQAPNCRILNHYGPTETTIGVLTYPVENRQASDGAATVPLGRPLANTQVYILDEQLQPVPLGVKGELYIGGAGLARGYLNRPDLTAERFIANPFTDLGLEDATRNPESGETNAQFSNPKSSARLYKTGDIVRYLPDGNIEFIGRSDYQVKVRGFRIELGEIEAVLAQHPGVQQVVVAVREEEPNDKRLVAYVVSNREQAPSVSDLRGFLKEKLPDYMIPSVFMPLKALPLTANGKVDRLSLPAPDSLRPELDATYVAPQTEAEQVIATIWQELLHLEKVGINDNFFELGGHSLLLVQVHSKLQAIFHNDISIIHLFEYPTVSSLANYLSQEKRQSNSFEESKKRAESRRNARRQRA